MADRVLTVDIVTPERVVLRDQATSLVAPGPVGSFGVLPSHAPLLSELGIGELRYRKQTGQEIRMAVGGGFIQVFNNQITVLADAAEMADQIDTARARQALEQGRQDMRAAIAHYDTERQDEADRAIRRAQNRLQVAGERP